jgi:hypothetical protein
MIHQELTIILAPHSKNSGHCNQHNFRISYHYIANKLLGKMNINRGSYNYEMLTFFLFLIKTNVGIAVIS